MIYLVKQILYVYMFITFVLSFYEKKKLYRRKKPKYPSGGNAVLVFLNFNQRIITKLKYSLNAFKYL